MEHKWLEDFVILAKTNNFTRAAEERNVTQSAFSRRIKSLETWLGTPLVDRSTYPTTLTPEGVVFRRAAEEMLRNFEQMRDEIRPNKGAASYQVQLIAQHTIASTFLPCWLKTIQRELGPFGTQVTTDDVHNCIHAFVDGTSDFLLCHAHLDISIGLDTDQYSYLVIGEDCLIPVSSPTARGKPVHRLPGSKRSPLPFLCYGTATFVGRVAELCISRGPEDCHLTPRCENAMAEALRAMVLEGHGLAWLPKSSVNRDLREGRLVRAGDDKWEEPLDIRIYRRLDPMKALGEDIWSFVSAAVRQD